MQCGWLQPSERSVRPRHPLTTTQLSRCNLSDAQSGECPLHFQGAFTRVHASSRAPLETSLEAEPYLSSMPIRAHSRPTKSCLNSRRLGACFIHAPISSVEIPSRSATTSNSRIRLRPPTVCSSFGFETLRPELVRSFHKHPLNQFASGRLQPVTKISDEPAHRTMVPKRSVDQHRRPNFAEITRSESSRSIPLTRPQGRGLRREARSFHQKARGPYLPPQEEWRAEVSPQTSFIINRPTTNGARPSRISSSRIMLVPNSTLVFKFNHGVT